MISIIEKRGDAALLRELVSSGNLASTQSDMLGVSVRQARFKSEKK